MTSEAKFKFINLRLCKVLNLNLVAQTELSSILHPLALGPIFSAYPWLYPALPRALCPHLNIPALIQTPSTNVASRPRSPLGPSRALTSSVARPYEERPKEEASVNLSSEFLSRGERLPLASWTPHSGEGCDERGPEWDPVQCGSMSRAPLACPKAILDITSPNSCQTARKT